LSPYLADDARAISQVISDQRQEAREDERAKQEEAARRREEERQARIERLAQEKEVAAAEYSAPEPKAAPAPILARPPERPEPDAKGMVSVLPFQFRDAAIDSGSYAAIEESIRSVTADTVGAFGYTVLDGENQLRLLQDNDIDPSKVCNATCSLGAAREMNAVYFVTGLITKSEGVLVAFIRLYRTKDGRQIGSIEINGDSVRAIRDAFRQRAAELFADVSG
jgi:hypothetical protein